MLDAVIQSLIGMWPVVILYLFVAYSLGNERGGNLSTLPVFFWMTAPWILNVVAYESGWETIALLLLFANIFIFLLALAVVYQAFKDP